MLSLEERADVMIEKKLKLYSLELERASHQVRILTEFKEHLKPEDKDVFDSSWFLPAMRRHTEAMSKASFWQDRSAVLIWMSRKVEGL